MTGAATIDRAKTIPGWMADAELVWLAEHAAQARTIIEAGCWQGRSTRALADHMPAGGVLYAVDPWSGTYYADSGSPHRIQTDVYTQFAEHLSDHIATGRVVPIAAAFTEAALAPTFAHLESQIDLVFLDGDHRYEWVLADILAARILLRRGGMLAGHDYSHPTWPGVRRAVDAIFPHADTCHSIWWVTV